MAQVKYATINSMIIAKPRRSLTAFLITIEIINVLLSVKFISKRIVSLD